MLGLRVAQRRTLRHVRCMSSVPAEEKWNIKKVRA